MVQRDGASDIKALLTDEWNSTNVEGTTPVIDLFDNRKAIELGHSDFVLVRTASRIFKRNAIGSTSKRKIHLVLIDIRTGTSRDRELKLFDEVVRILDANLVNPSSTNLPAGSWDWLEHDVEWPDFSDRMKGLWRISGEIKLIVATMNR